jgi:glycosyltransferase involved in cell wall biosynthesis/ubiquinone/menaquinone biosynthesis C-methylase UbiE
MKILAVLTFYHPHWTGLTAHAVRLAEQLAERGHQVTVLTTRHDPTLSPDEMVNGVRVVRLSAVLRFSRGLIAPTFPAVARSLIAEHDLVQIHTPLPEALLVAALCRLLRRPLVMTHHGDVVMPAGVFNKAVEQAAFLLLRTAGTLADAVTAYSADYASHSPLLSSWAHKLSYIYPPVDLPPPDLDACADWRAQLGLTDRTLLGFAGRWVEEKGFDYLLRALPAIQASIPNVHLVYAGDYKVAYENFYDRCRPLVEAQRERLTMVGLLRDPQRLANFYALCDLVVVPSRTDNMPLVEIEALLSGTPLVVSDIPGARVVVQKTGFGRLSPPRDAAGLARTIVETLGERERYRPDRVAVRQIFDLARTIDQYESLFDRLVRRPGPARPGRVKSVPRSLALRQTDSQRRWRSLSTADQATLDRVLRNEADMAYRRRARVLLDYLELEDGQRVLDCGCGMGFYLMAMSRLRCLRLVGLDGNPARLAWARRERVPAGLLRGDIERLPFPAAVFDRILLTEVLEHLVDDRRGLAELYRVLRPGGVLAISVPHADYPFWWDPINRVWTALGGAPIRDGPFVGLWTDHQRLYRPDELVERVAEAGFAVETVEETTHYSFPFIHFLVYGVGKPLLERGLLPDELAASADRFGGEQNDGSLLNPINLGLAAFRAVDRLNDRPAVTGKRTFVNVLLKARKPDAE